MQIYYCANIEGNNASFSFEESGHCIRVLRMKKGDKLNFTDGKGCMYEGVIINPDQKKMEVSVTSVIKDYGKRNYSIHIAISPLKNSDRLEWFIEKAVEIGIDEITPLLCSRTEKTRIKRERIENLMQSAVKQSVKSYIPVLNEPMLLNDFLKGQYPGLKLIAHCDSDIERLPIQSVLKKEENITIMIGPEGDFTNDEVSKATTSGFISVNLGPSRLRTETAGLVACCSVYLTNV